MLDQFICVADSFNLFSTILSQTPFQDMLEVKEHIFHAKDCESVPMVLVGNIKDLDAFCDPQILSLLIFSFLASYFLNLHWI